MIPLFFPHRTNIKRVYSYLSDTLNSKWWGQGPKVEEFEKEFGNKFGFLYSVFLNSCTSALHLALILAGVKDGDEVLTTVLTCTATNIPILYQRAKPVFCDIQKNTLNIDPEDIHRKITSKTKAIMVVHFGGIMCDMVEIMKIAKKHNLKVIEDAAHALGARGVGMGDYTCFSFQAIKHITTGDGGMLIVSNEEDYKRAKKLRWYGIDRERKHSIVWQDWTTREVLDDVEEVGYKYHSNDIMASLGLAALKEFDKVFNYRKKLSYIYYYALRDNPAIKLLKESSSYWLYTILVNNRDKFAELLKDKEIETNVVHIRNDVYKIFGRDKLDLPVMNEIENQYLCLPLNTQITEDQVRYICDTINNNAKEYV